MAGLSGAPMVLAGLNLHISVGCSRTVLSLDMVGFGGFQQLCDSVGGIDIGDILIRRMKHSQWLEV